MSSTITVQLLLCALALYNSGSCSDIGSEDDYGSDKDFQVAAYREKLERLLDDTEDLKTISPRTDPQNENEDHKSGVRLSEEERVTSMPTHDNVPSDHEKKKGGFLQKVLGILHGMGVINRNEEQEEEDKGVGSHVTQHPTYHAMVTQPINAQDDNGSDNNESEESDNQPDQDEPDQLPVPDKEDTPVEVNPESEKQSSPDTDDNGNSGDPHDDKTPESKESQTDNGEKSDENEDDGEKKVFLASWMKATDVVVMVLALFAMIIAFVFIMFTFLQWRRTVKIIGREQARSRQNIKVIRDDIHKLVSSHSFMIDLDDDYEPDEGDNLLSGDSYHTFGTVATDSNESLVLPVIRKPAKTGTMKVKTRGSKTPKTSASKSSKPNPLDQSINESGTASKQAGPVATSTPRPDKKTPPRFPDENVQDTPVKGGANKSASPSLAHQKKTMESGPHGSPKLNKQ